MFWALLQQTGKTALTFLVFATLALLLSPHEFGVLGMSSSWLAFIALFSELGFGAALIQRRKIDEKYFSTVFYLNIATGVVLTLVAVGVSWPCAAFFHTPEVQPVMAIMSLSLFLNSISSTQTAIAQRKIRFRNLAVRDLIAALVGGIVAIVFAFLKFGVWSLVAQTLVTSAAGALLLWNMSEWKPRLRDFSVDCVKDLWEYSSRMFAFSIFKYFAQNVDKLLIGHMLGTVALGMYTFAFKVVVFPVNQLAGAVGTYLFPKLSRLQEHLFDVRTLFLFMNRAINSVTIPFAALVIVASSIIVPRLFGEQWMPSIAMMNILVVVAAAQSMIALTGQLMKSLNRPGWLLWWSVFFSAVIALMMWGGIELYGGIGAVLGLSVAHAIALPVNLYLTTRLVPMTRREIVMTVLPSFVATLAWAVGAWYILRIEIVLNDVQLSLLFVTCAIVYLVILGWLDKSLFSALYRKVLRHEIGGGVVLHEESKS